MSLYSELLERVSRGAKYKIDLVQKTLKVDGKEIALEGNLIDDTMYNKWDAWKIVENLYAKYKRSVPSERHNGNKPYFKCDSIEDLTDDEIAFNVPRNEAQFKLECYVLFASVLGWLKFESENHWFWQSKVFPECVVLKEWI